MFTNCKINAVRVCSNTYHEGKGRRGDPDFRMSPSGLKTFAANPAKWVRGYSLPESGAKRWGSLLDTRLLTPERFDESYAIQPDTYKATAMECPICKGQSDAKSCRACKTERVEIKIDKEWNNNSLACSAWSEIQKQGGRHIVDNGEMTESGAAIARLRGDELIKSWHEACETQVHVVGEWHDKATGVAIPVECLIDYVPKTGTEFENCLGDFKTTMNAGLRAFARWSWTAGYHVQAAFDTDMFNMAAKDERNTWVFILSENFPPYEPGRRMLSQDFMDMGRAYYRHALARYARCLKTNVWPSYDDNAQAIQGWSLIQPEPWMAFEAQSDAMEHGQQSEVEDGPLCLN